VGIIKTVFTSPFKLVGWGAKKIKGAISSGEEENPIETIIPTNRPLAYQYYYQGQPQDYIGGNLVIWKSEKQRKKALKELKKVA
jgi:hypothetical protein